MRTVTILQPTLGMKLNESMQRERMLKRKARRRHARQRIVLNAISMTAAGTLLILALRLAERIV